MRRHNSVFIAATGQNVGKSTICLGVLAGLQKRFSSVGFIKPVGQQHVKIDCSTRVDKDVVLFKERFQLPAAWNDMSPVIIPAGFTRDFLDEKVTEASMKDKIESAFLRIYKNNEYTVVEGTGHVGVGSIVEMNNAKVASQLGLDVVIIASGGLGSAYDELALNFAMCKEYNVKIRGIILNRVLEDKREMILEYVPKSLKKWGIPLIGCVPYNEFLSNNTIEDFVNLFKTSAISGAKHQYRHFLSTRLVAGSLEAFYQEMVPNELVITPASRKDIIRAILDKHEDVEQQNGKDFGGGIILTGTQKPDEDILNEIRRIDIPSLYAPVCTYDAMKMITNFTAKMRIEDTHKVEKAIKLVEDNIDFNLLQGITNGIKGA